MIGVAAADRGWTDASGTECHLRRAAGPYWKPSFLPDPASWLGGSRFSGPTPGTPTGRPADKVLPSSRQIASRRVLDWPGESATGQDRVPPIRTLQPRRALRAVRVRASSQLPGSSFRGGRPVAEVGQSRGSCATDTFAAAGQSPAPLGPGSAGVLIRGRKV
ncbi:hypothetical protein VTN02DRAFT_1531 [Thermoascus thermophilus]